ncbi:MAG: hypothetical protein PUD73_08265 [bacterium]|nr:hypothetical protein [bacterium]
MGSNPTLCATSEQASYCLLRFLFKNQSALMPLLLLFRKKSRWLRLFACKRAHDASAALPTFCGASAVLFRHNIHIANRMQNRLKRLFFLWHFKLMGLEAVFLSVFQSEKTIPLFRLGIVFLRDAPKDLSSLKKCSTKIGTILHAVLFTNTFAGPRRCMHPCKNLLLAISLLRCTDPFCVR